MSTPSCDEHITTSMAFPSARFMCVRVLVGGCVCLGWGLCVSGGLGVLGVSGRGFGLGAVCRGRGEDPGRCPGGGRRT